MRDTQNRSARPEPCDMRCSPSGSLGSGVAAAATSNSSASTTPSPNGIGGHMQTSADGCQAELPTWGVSISGMNRGGSWRPSIQRA